MFARIGKGLRAYLTSFRFLTEHSLGRLALLPAFVGVFVGFLLIGATFFASGLIAKSLLAYLNSFFQAPEFIGTILRLVLVAAGVVLAVIVYRPLTSLFVLPCIGPLLGSVEKVLLGAEIKTTVGADIQSALVGGWLGARASAFGLFAFTVTIPLGPVQPFIMFFVDAYILGKSAFDFVFEKETTTIAERQALIRQFRWEILGVGIGFFVMLLIPLLGIAMAPVIAVIAAARIRHGDPARVASSTK